jgi:hypothetical protein
MGAGRVGQLTREAAPQSSLGGASGAQAPHAAPAAGPLTQAGGVDDLDYALLALALSQVQPLRARVRQHVAPGERARGAAARAASWA